MWGIFNLNNILYGVENFCVSGVRLRLVGFGRFLFAFRFLV